MYEIALLSSLLTYLGILFYYLRSPAASIFHPFSLFMGVHGLIFVLRPICGYFLHYDGLYIVYQFNPTIEERSTVIFASNLSLICFSFWCLRIGNGKFRFNFDRFDEEERRRMTQVFSISSLIILPVALYSMYDTYGSLAQGAMVQGMVIDKASGYQYNTASNGYITDAQLMLVPWVAMVAWLGRFRPLALVPLALFVVARAAAGGRGPFMIALLSAGLLYCFETRRRLPPIRFLAYAAPALALFSLIGLDRGATLRELAGLKVEVNTERSIEEGNQRKFLEAMDWANMEFFEYLVYVIPQRSQTYDYFLDNFQIFTDPIPRQFWPGKPKGEPFRSIFLFDYGTPVGMTRSIPGEGWYAMGWLGVIIWSSLWGAFIGTVYRKFNECKQTTMQTACYMVFVPSLLIAYRDGALASVVHNAGVYLAPVGIWFLLARGFAVPKAGDLRKRWFETEHKAQARAAAQAEGGDATAQEARLAAELAAEQAIVPPAVRRRRAALKALHTSSSEA